MVVLATVLIAGGLGLLFLYFQTSRSALPGAVAQSGLTPVFPDKRPTGTNPVAHAATVQTADPMDGPSIANENGQSSSEINAPEPPRPDEPQNESLASVRPTRTQTESILKSATFERLPTPPAARGFVGPRQSPGGAVPDKAATAPPKDHNTEKRSADTAANS
ncbi:MAG: hypothetical protein KDK39_04320, partial [Leptospiraceae bacterium]|nr:hypothetical protein [Leptospiraceae bacterium]